MYVHGFFQCGHNFTSTLTPWTRPVDDGICRIVLYLVTWRWRTKLILSISSFMGMNRFIESVYSDGEVLTSNKLLKYGWEAELCGLANIEAVLLFYVMKISILWKLSGDLRLYPCVFPVSTLGTLHVFMVSLCQNVWQYRHHKTKKVRLSSCIQKCSSGSYMTSPRTWPEKSSCQPNKIFPVREANLR
jgi:hypothetical protein